MLGGGLLLVVATALIAFLVGMRMRAPRVVDTVRRVNRAVFNPMQMRSAGTPGAFASVIRHTGRTSGRPYETPVGAVATDGGFVIALPYGRRADWLKNVLASGSAEIVHEGRTYRVDQPEVVPMAQAASDFPAAEQRTHRLFGVEHCLRLRHVEPQHDDVGAPATSPG
jgi:deazaflavin-dependent oxidoreductase (nitroreductase family)